jgi:hypothetical protein
LPAKNELLNTPTSSPAPHPAAFDIGRLLAECRTRRGRRSGPGGQHRNKVETAIVVTHEPTGVTGTATERRSQQQNRQAAIFRLRVNLALQVRMPRDGAASPSVLWQDHCRGGRIVVRATHADFPALLAESLDVLAACDMDVQAAAGTLGVTASQLTRFLKLESGALAQVNRRRRELGLRPLR